MEMWGDVYTFLQNNEDASPKSRKKLMELLENCPGEVLVELAVYVDAGEELVKATYRLEGDDPLVFDCYEIIAGVRSAIQVSHWPNTKAIAKTFTTPTKSEQFWLTYASDCVQKGFDYFEEKFFHGELLPVVNAFKSARLFNPTKVIDLKPDATAVDSL